MGQGVASCKTLSRGRYNYRGEKVRGKREEEGDGVPGRDYGENRGVGYRSGGSTGFENQETEHKRRE